jgi:hypothetical protein
MGKLPKFSLARLVMCGGGYQRLSSQEYLRLGLCLPDSCPDCAEGGSGHYVKNDKMVKNNLLLNNQVLEEKVSGGPQPLKKIVNNLANETTATTTTTTTSCNRCKENSGSGCDQADPKCSSKEPKKSGFVNLAFVDSISEASAWYQPHLPRELAVKILSDCTVGSFIVRTSQSQIGSGCLALTVRVPKSFNGTGILHYLIVVSESGFRIKGFSKVFPSLSGLVVHHSVMKEALPCRLVTGEDLSEDESDRESDFADLDADPEYPGLLSRLRAELSH